MTSEGSKVPLNPPGDKGESRSLRPEEIRAVLNEPTQQGGWQRKPGAGPLSKIGAPSHSLATGMGFNHVRAAYHTQFGVEAPTWLEQLHPYHAAKLCKLCLSQNATFPEVYPACPLT